MDRHLHWTVPVNDAFDREREFRVGVRDGQVVLLPPPGEGCTVTPGYANYLAASIQAASERAEMRER